MSYLKILLFIPLFLIQPVFGEWSEQCKMALDAYNKASVALRQALFDDYASALDALIKAQDDYKKFKPYDDYKKAEDAIKKAEDVVKKAEDAIKKANATFQEAKAVKEKHCKTTDS